jgi:hypothetical protein
MWSERGGELYGAFPFSQGFLLGSSVFLGSVKACFYTIDIYV